MRSMPPVDRTRPRLVFLHLPKTAGTTIHNILIKQFDKEDICPERLDQISTYSFEEVAAFKLFSMHDSFDNLVRIPNPKKIFTVFRDPIERILSQYQYWRSHSTSFITETNQDWLHQFKEMDLSTYLQASDCRFLHGIDNLMTRHLSHNYLNRNGEPWRDDQEMLDAAMQNLEKLDAFGIFEFLPESIDLMCRTFDIPAIKKVETLNNTRNNFIDQPEIFEPPPPVIVNDEAEELLIYRTRLDTILYETAKAKFLTHIPDKSRKIFTHNHTIGQLVNHYDRSVIHSNLGEHGYVIYGPYTNLRKGTYRITMDIGTESTLSDRHVARDTPIAELDVCSEFGDVVYTVRSLCAGDLQPGFYSPIELIFTLEKTTTEIEFRVKSLGNASISVNTQLSLETLA